MFCLLKVFGLFLMLLVISSCNTMPIPDDLPLPTPSVEAVHSLTTPLPISLEQRIYAVLQEQLGVSETAVELQQIREVEWQDACLEAAQPDEFCAQVITPGYRIVAELPQGQAILHSDRSGQSIRVVQVP
jgi:hypothetical protein